jgi:Glycosyl hydrolases family 16
MLEVELKAGLPSSDPGVMRKHLAVVGLLILFGAGTGSSAVLTRALAKSKPLTVIQREKRLGPKPTPHWYWRWVQWRLGEGFAKGHQFDQSMRPHRAPNRIPHWTWRRLHFSLLARKQRTLADQRKRSRKHRPTTTTTTTNGTGGAGTTTTTAAGTGVDPSGQSMPVGDTTISGQAWHQIFADNFPASEDISLGSSCGDPNAFPHAANVSGKWNAYPYPWSGTPTWGTYCPERTTSIHGGLMDIWLHSEQINGTWKHLIDAVQPIVAGRSQFQGQLYGRYVIRYEQSASFPMFHESWLLWPDSNTWPRDGEIDFPEADTNSSSTSAFMHRQGGTSGGSQDAYSAKVPIYGAWHTAVIEWLPTRCTFILDGNVVGNSTSNVPNTQMHWVIQNGGNFGATPDNTSQGHLYIDWVSIYARG